MLIPEILTRKIDACRVKRRVLRKRKTGEFVAENGLGQVMMGQGIVPPPFRLVAERLRGNALGNLCEPARRLASASFAHGAGVPQYLVMPLSVLTANRA